MSKLAPTADSTQQAPLGKWIWKDDTNTLEFIGLAAGAERQVGKRGAGHKGKPGVHFPDNKHGRSSPSSKFLRDRRSGRQAAKGDEKVTLSQVKCVAYDLMAQEDEISHTFERLFERFQFDEFLSCLFNYFHYFFEKKTHEEKPNPMNIDMDGNPVPVIETRACSKDTYNEPSAKEKRYYAELCANVEGAQKLLGSAYCVLVMGIGLGEQHHMARGMSRVSNTYQDRYQYETLYKYCTYAVWVAFKRKDKEAIKKEISRMLRSDTFNPAIRVKNAPDSDEEEEEDKKKLSPAEYRRVQGKRPPIKSIIMQRSPALVSILPSPKEESNYLFKYNAGKPPKTPTDQDDDEEEEIVPLHLVNTRKLKLGIIGEPLNNFSKTSLTPNDSEHDGEDGEQDGEKRQSSIQQMKSVQDGNGMTREATGMSATTVEALPDED